MTPNINIQNGSVTGTLVHGQNFYWYNPGDTSLAISITGCSGWCTSPSYIIPAGENYAQAQLLSTPVSPYTFSESPNQWNAPGMPHTQGPINHPSPEHKPDEEHKKEVA
jgi:hypothetical protein